MAHSQVCTWKNVLPAKSVMLPLAWHPPLKHRARAGRTACSLSSTEKSLGLHVHVRCMCTRVIPNISPSAFPPPSAMLPKKDGLKDGQAHGDRVQCLFCSNSTSWNSPPFPIHQIIFPKSVVLLKSSGEPFFHYIPDSGLPRAPCRARGKRAIC